MKNKNRTEYWLRTYGSFHVGDMRIEFNHCGVELFRGQERIAIMGWKRFEAAMVSAERQKRKLQKVA